MRKIRHNKIRIIIVVMLCLQTSYGFSQKYFTVEDCIAYAFENNPVLQIVSADTSISDLDILRVRGSYIPRMDFTAALQYYIEERNQIIEGGSYFAPATLPEGEPIAIPIGYKNAWYPSMNISQLIFDGAYQSSYNIASQNRDLQKQEVWSYKIDLIAGISKAYTSCRLLEIQANYLKENIQRVDTLIELTRVKYAEGAGVKLEVNRVEVTGNRMRSELANVYNAFNEALLALQFQMNYLEQDSIILTTIIEIDEMVRLAAITRDSLQFSNPTARIESKILQTQISLFDESINLEQSRYQPSIGADGSLGFSPAADAIGNIFQSERWKPYAYVGLNMYVPIFNGMDVKRAVEQRTLESMQARNYYNEFINAYENDRKITYYQLKNALEKFNYADINLSLAENNITLLEDAFINGIADNQDMILGENDLYENQAFYFNELLKLVLKQIEGRKVMGSYNSLAGVEN